MSDGILVMRQGRTVARGSDARADYALSDRIALRGFVSGTRERNVSLFNDICEFRSNPATHTDLISAAVPN